jgi:hypothetical protein
MRNLYTSKLFNEFMRRYYYIKVHCKLNNRGMSIILCILNIIDIKLNNNFRYAFNIKFEM